MNIEEQLKEANEKNAALQKVNQLQESKIEALEGDVKAGEDLLAEQVKKTEAAEEALEKKNQEQKTAEEIGAKIAAKTIAEARAESPEENNQSSNDTNKKKTLAEIWATPVS